ncbi:MAG: DEAD/DEAH box helicase, partial [Methylococcaceae bacterium]|nr:DEAD/DEAH box helicase [Methylococcaceae bacterium]
MNNTHLTETRFSNLELSDSILHGLNDAGFNHCTPIQDKALPLLLRSKDIAGQAQTGTGKTATFLLATFQRLLNDDDCTDAEGTTPGMGEVEQRRERLPRATPGAVAESKRFKNPRAIILAPTRELAIQIHKDALLLGKHLNLKFALIYGGTDYQ